MTTRQQRGQNAEALAARFLGERGFTILTTNWHCRYGELDIIAQEGETIVFVEVRARSTGGTSAAFASIGPRKQARLAAAVQLYLAEHHLEDAAWRIDAIAVGLRGGAAPVIEHVENALDW
jgi:putative endonuclease